MILVGLVGEIGVRPTEADGEDPVLYAGIPAETIGEGALEADSSYLVYLPAVWNSSPCDPGKTRCVTLWQPEGVCVDLDTDPNHCGECGNQCEGMPVKQEACVDGQCLTCNEGCQYRGYSGGICVSESCADRDYPRCSYGGPGGDFCVFNCNRSFEFDEGCASVYDCLCYDTQPCDCFETQDCIGSGCCTPEGGGT